MNSQKVDNLLDLALDSTTEEREKSLNLNVGYNSESHLWDVVVKYTGNIKELESDTVEVVELLNGYAVVTLPEEEIMSLSQRPEVEYIEKPKRLFFAAFQGREVSCIPQVQREPYQLTGRGVLVGIVDSGVDYRHPDFCNEDGSTRILRLWDQTVQGNAPEGYRIGTEYTKAQIDEALRLPPQEGYQVVASRDLSGHGTSVLGIAAGNGRASDGVNRGVAYDSELMVVKLGTPRENSFPKTTELMQGVDYLLRQSLALRRPIVINLSFGNNYGSHQGNSLLETYLDQVADMGRCSVCVGAGNNGNQPLHTAGTLARGQQMEIEVAVGEYESALNIQLWKSYVQDMDIYLIHPSGQQVGPLYENLGTQRHILGQTELLIYYGEPSPYLLAQEIYMDFIPKSSYIDTGIWKIRLRNRSANQGKFNLWLPGGNVLNSGTGFYMPTPEFTLTIPSTARKVISVGAYDSRYLTYSDFSGRGLEGMRWNQKPDLVAPGVDILAARPGNGYGSVTGTSFATPFVAGSAALLMEWGIVKENDPYLSGEKLKAYLQRGAVPLPEFTEYPNSFVGYGALCLRNSLPV